MGLSPESHECSTGFNGGDDTDGDCSWEKLPRHRDEEQVQLDVDRSFVYYPTGACLDDIITLNPVQTFYVSLFAFMCRVINHVCLAFLLFS